MQPSKSFNLGQARSGKITASEVVHSGKIIAFMVVHSGRTNTFQAVVAVRFRTAFAS